MIYTFLASFDLALDHANRLRPQMPALYNAARVNEMPIPSVCYIPSVRCAENTDDETHEEELSSNENEAQCDVKQESFEQVQLDAADISALNDIFSVDNDSIVDDFDIEPNENIENEILSGAEPNNPLENNGNMELASDAIGSTNVTDSDIHQQNENLENESVSHAEQNDSLENNGNMELASQATGSTNATTQKFGDEDEDLEFTYTSEADFLPHQVKDGYIIKLNDELTDYWPFKLNVIL